MDVLRRLRRGSRIPALALVSAMLLAAGVVLGLHVPGVGYMHAFPDVGRLDYSAGPPGGFAPLDSRLVDELLGKSARGPVEVGASARTLAGMPTRDLTEFRPQGAGPQTTPAILAPGGYAQPGTQVRHPLVNDGFVNAFRVPTVPFTARTSTADATAEPREQHCGPLAGKSAWYAFTPARDLALQGDTFGTDAAISLAVYTGSGVGDLEPVPDAPCSSDARGNALVAFRAGAGTTYYFQVDGPVAAEIVFTLQEQGVTRRASVGSSGQESDGVSLFGVISHDGGRVLLASGASTFDDPHAQQPCARAVRGTGAGAPCGKVGIYLRDGVRRSTTNQYPSQNVAIGATDKGSLAIPGSSSADGRYFVFWATVQLRTPAAGDSQKSSPYRFEVFRHDRITGVNERVSVPHPQCGCADTDGSSARPEISADGRHVAFVSWASNIVSGDRNGVRDVFVRDMVAGVTARVSVGSDHDRVLGEPNDDTTQDPTQPPTENGDSGADLFSISRDGRFVVFKSSSSNLVRDDTNHVADVFVRDRAAGTTARVNVSTRGAQADHQTKSVLGLGLRTISDDGRFVFFNSNASNLVSPPTADYVENVYRRDLRTGVTILVTTSSDGVRADRGVDRDAERVAFTYLAPLLVAGGTDVGLSGLSYSATPDGRVVVFNSDATNLVPGDRNESTDIFLRDLGTATTIRVSVNSSGEEAAPGKNCGTPGLSDDAGFVVFDCDAENLVADDTNNTNDVFVRELPRARPLSGWY